MSMIQKLIKVTLRVFENLGGLASMCDVLWSKWVVLHYEGVCVKLVKCLCLLRGPVDGESKAWMK